MFISDFPGTSKELDAKEEKKSQCFPCIVSIISLTCNNFLMLANSGSERGSHLSKRYTASKPQNPVVCYPLHYVLKN